MIKKMTPVVPAVLVASVIAAGNCGGGGTDREGPRDVGSVAILVVDSFDPGMISLPERDQEKPGNCAYASLPANVVGGKGGPDDSLPTGVAHGTLVFDELAGKLAADGRLTAISNPNRATYGAGSTVVKRFDAWRYGDREIVLAGMETSSFDAQAVREGIELLIRGMGEARAFSRFVINMSFVMAPCNRDTLVTIVNDPHSALDVYRVLIEDVQPLNDLRDTLEAVARGDLPAEPSLNRARQYLTDPVLFRRIPDRTKIRMFYGARLNDFLDRPGTQQLLRSDPLGIYLRDLSGRPDLRVISVAAAGNGIGYRTEDEVLGVRLDFPFAPALWNVVLSVSAHDEDSRTPASYSNSGEVLANGSISYEGGTLRGTSFAAPLVSYEQAFFLLADGRQTCGADMPPLGYADFENLKRDWRNLPLDEAVGAYCQEFTRRTASPVVSVSPGS